MFAQGYFSPSYFSPMYFASSDSGSGGGTGPPAPTVGYRDRDAYAAIVAILGASGEFADVAFGLPLDRAVISPHRIPLAVVSPAGWVEVDDVDPIVNVRQVSYTLTLVVRGEDGYGRFQQLDRLTSVVQDALDGSDLGGCLPGLTKLRKGRPDPDARHPEQRLILTGEFTYLIFTQAGHDVAV